MFTRKGDSGSTDTGDRRRVSKSSSLVEVEGTLDEAFSNIGNAIALSKWEDIKNDLRITQEDLFTLGEEITASGHARKLDPGRVEWLEERVVIYRKEVGPIRLFIVPDGTLQSTSLHIARTDWCPWGDIMFSLEPTPYLARGKFQLENIKHTPVQYFKSLANFLPGSVYFSSPIL